MTNPSEVVPPQPQEPRRRLLLYAGVAAAAALGGAGAALWMRQPAGSEHPDPALWTMNFETPAGQPLAMEAFRGKPLVINFWATWCPPCVDEMPLLDAFYRENAAKGWQLLGLAVDQLGAVRTFLERRPVSYPIALAGPAGTVLSTSLGNRAGGLPYTVVLGADGKILQRRMGRLTEAELALWPRLI